MARMSYDEALGVITDTINGAGGKMSHNDLVAALEGSGYALAPRHLRSAQKRGDLSVALAVQPSGPAILFYSVPGAEPAPAPPASS